MNYCNNCKSFLSDDDLIDETYVDSIYSHGIKYISGGDLLCPFCRSNDIDECNICKNCNENGTLSDLCDDCLDEYLKTDFVYDYSKKRNVDLIEFCFDEDEKKEILLKYLTTEKLEKFINDDRCDFEYYIENYAKEGK